MGENIKHGKVRHGEEDNIVSICADCAAQKYAKKGTFTEMKRWYAPIGILVECEDCSWTTGSYKNGQAISKIHAEKHGHRVHGELYISFGYDGRKEASGEAPK